MIVAAVSQLAGLVVEDATVGHFGLYLVLFAAFWFVWAGIMVHSNIAGDRLAVVIVAMLGIGAMSMAAYEIDDRGVVFAVSYVATRLVTGAAWERGTVVVDWPLAKLSAGVTPWIVSLFFSGTWQHGLWAVGILADMVLMATMDDERAERSAREMVERIRRRKARRAVSEADDAFQLEVVRTESEHLAERLGLFVIIVLGEGVVRLIDAAASGSWTWSGALSALLAFALVVEVWALGLLRGVAGVPGAVFGEIAARHTMLVHLGLTCGIATLASGLHVALHDPDELAEGSAWLVAGGLALYFGSVAVSRAFAGRRELAWPLACTLAAVAVGIGADRLDGRELIASCAAIGAAGVALHLLTTRGQPANAAG